MRLETGGDEFHQTFRRLVREGRGSPWLLLCLGGMLVLAWISTVMLKDTIPRIAKIATTLTSQASKILSRILSLFSRNESNYQTTLHHIFQIKLLHYSYLLLLPLLYKAIQLLFHHFNK
jgi:hypothetical protein